MGDSEDRTARAMAAFAADQGVATWFLSDEDLVGQVDPAGAIADGDTLIDAARRMAAEAAKTAQPSVTQGPSPRPLPKVDTQTPTVPEKANKTGNGGHTAPTADPLSGSADRGGSGDKDRRGGAGAGRSSAPQSGKSREAARTSTNGAPVKTSGWDSQATEAPSRARAAPAASAAASSGTGSMRASGAKSAAVLKASGQGVGDGRSKGRKVVAPVEEEVVLELGADGAYELPDEEVVTPAPVSSARAVKMTAAKPPEPPTARVTAKESQGAEEVGEGVVELETPVQVDLASPVVDGHTTASHAEPQGLDTAPSRPVTNPDSVPTSRSDTAPTSRSVSTETMPMTSPGSHPPKGNRDAQASAPRSKTSKSKRRKKKKHTPVAQSSPTPTVVATTAPIRKKKGKKGRKATAAAATAAARAKRAAGAGGNVAYASVTSEGKEHVQPVKLSADEVQEMVSGDGTKQYAGTFRWPATHKFMKLPPCPPSLGPILGALKGWQQYLGIRFPGEAQTEVLEGMTDKDTARRELQAAADATDASTDDHFDGDKRLVVEPALLDGLSFPMSAIVAARAVGFRPRLGETFTIIVIGASSKAEQRIAEKTQYFLELKEYFGSMCSDIRLVLVGPEMDCKQRARLRREELAPGFTYTPYKGTVSDFFTLEKTVDPRTTLVVGYNTGFGAGNKPLTLSWLPSLAELARRNLTCIFTCANDYSDVRGEILVMQNVIGANFVKGPFESPFRAVSTFHAPGARDKEWSCANSFSYVIRGFEADGPKLDVFSGSTLKRALDIIFPS